MPREIKKNTKKKKTKKSSSSLQLNLIILLLLVQITFLLYKNKDYFLNDVKKNSEVFAGSSVFYPSLENEETTSLETENPNIAEKTKTEAEIEKQLDVPKHTGVVKLNVLNGCGVSGIAGRWKYRLIKKKYDVRETGNAEKRTANSLIISRIPDMNPAYKLAEAIGITKDNVYQVSNNDLVDIDLTVIIGMDYKKLKVE